MLKLDQKVHEELDTVQRRYLTMLEGKLIQFDQEAARLKADKEIEYISAFMDISIQVEDLRVFFLFFTD